MVELSSPQLDRLFHGMAQCTRRAILMELSYGERTVGQLAEPFDTSLAAISKHIKVLEAAELLVQRQSGRTRVCRLNPKTLAKMAKVIAFYQETRCNALESGEGPLVHDHANGAESDPASQPS